MDSRGYRPINSSTKANSRCAGERASRTYLFEDLPNDRTRISLEFAWLEAPRLERLGTPLARAFVRRANGSAMRRLAKRLAQR
jgi:hypothetical protein